MSTKQQANITVYSKGYCPFCMMTKATLKKLGLSFRELDVTHNKAYDKEMRQRSRRRTVPQIFINDHHIGGNDDLQAALRNGDFERILKAETASA